MNDDCCLTSVTSDLRGRIASLETNTVKKPVGCLCLDVPHEFAGGGSSTVDGAAAALFAAKIAAPTKKSVIWCLT
ncbi:hypothetical protein A6R70_21130 [Agrobacterium rubi]|nr:hypothetical protein [Agrobacterium rubi]